MASAGGLRSKRGVAFDRRYRPKLRAQGRSRPPRSPMGSRAETPCWRGLPRRGADSRGRFSRSADPGLQSLRHLGRQGQRSRPSLLEGYHRSGGRCRCHLCSRDAPRRVPPIPPTPIRPAQSRSRTGEQRLVPALRNRHLPHHRPPQVCSLRPPSPAPVQSRREWRTQRRRGSQGPRIRGLVEQVPD